MKPQKQKFKHDEANSVFGDCHRTAIAMILNIDRDEVPHFMDGIPADAPHDDERVLTMFDRINAFLAERGLGQVHFALSGEMTLEDVLKIIVAWSRNSPVILGVKSSNDYHHSVVVHEGEIHNPNDSTIAGPCDDGFWWITTLSVGSNWADRLI